MKAEDICKKAAELVGGDRAKAYGDMRSSTQRIATLWNAYLKPVEYAISPYDVAIMMALLKIARAATGELNDDNYIDAAGYLGMAGQLARP